MKSEFIRYLDDADNDFMRITIRIQQVEFHHWIIFAQVVLDVCDLVVQQMFLDFFTQDMKGIGKIDFQRTRIVR